MERMRTSAIIVCAALGIGLGACNRSDDRKEPAAKQAGRAAYQASQKIKQGAKEAARELHHAAKQAREGWNEAKHDDRSRPQK